MKLFLLVYLFYPTSVTLDGGNMGFTLNPCKGNCTAPTAQEPSTSLARGGVLYPRASESRNLFSLDGLWSFSLDAAEKGMRERWFDKDIRKTADAILMPVPSSYNDITTSASVRDHVGVVWYQRAFFVPASWETQRHRLWLRFGGVHYLARVWINGEIVLEHEIGHLPFQGEITRFVNFGAENKVTVAVDNRLGPETIPQGTLEPIDTANGSKIIQKYDYGFYNYAGIQRSVYLYTTPVVYIDDIRLQSKFEESNVFLHYELVCNGVRNEEISASVAVIDKDGKKAGNQSQTITGGTNVSGDIEITTPKLWWPYLMSPDPGYLYIVEITMKSQGFTDVYRHPFGLRNLRWDNESIYINNKPIYIRGISRHEDSDVIGRGLHLPAAVRDHNILKWLGANTYRTSHCPHAEESMDLAEQMGFMIIDEAPSINIKDFTNNLLLNHNIAIAEMINRDKNRACVIMWALSNEPVTEIPQAALYFKSVASFTRRRDATRPITAMLNRWYTVDQAAQWMDVICFNRYNGYFKEPGQWEMIQPAVEKEASYWYSKFRKPVIMSEYGTETHEGLHGLPDHLWTEEYQKRLLSEHFKAFDNLRGKGWFVGEILYCLTDFQAQDTLKRVGGLTKKGIFTRQRQPKLSAFLIKKRYFKLAANLNETSLPSDLELYVANE